MVLTFNGCTSLEKIEFGKINTSSLKNMAGLFQGCSNLKEVDLIIIY